MEKKHYTAPQFDIVKWLAGHNTLANMLSDPSSEDSGGWDDGWD